MIKREVINNLLKKDKFYFDENYSPAYYEETDLEFRIKKMGYNLIANPNSLIFHKGGGTSEKISQDYLLYVFLKNRKYFFEKHFNRFYFLPRLLNDIKKYFKLKKLHILAKAYLNE